MLGNLMMMGMRIGRVIAFIAAMATGALANTQVVPVEVEDERVKKIVTALGFVEGGVHRCKGFWLNWPLRKMLYRTLHPKELDASRWHPAWLTGVRNAEAEISSGLAAYCTKLWTLHGPDGSRWPKRLVIEADRR